MINAHAVIAGGGPAGMMLALLLARAGLKAIVLEKHADFLRDFRGDTIHPSTLDVIYELGFLDDFLQRPHQQLPKLRGWVGATQLDVADFSHLPTRCRFVALMPQWEFLDFLADEAKRFPGFELKMEAKVSELIEEGGRVVGVRAETPQGPLEIRAALTIGADGRGSLVRERAGLVIEEFGVPIDVLWFKILRREEDPPGTFGRFDRGKILVMLNRKDYWQIGYVIPKGGIEDLKRRGIAAMRAGIAEVAPFLTDRLTQITGWEDLKLLTVKVDRLKRWYKPGLLCIGDAAHAMSPVGGVGINLAIQDAVAAANLLTAPLKRGAVSERDLARVQRRRDRATRLTQRAQLLIQKSFLGAALQPEGFKTLPLALRILQRFPILARLPGRLIGIGFRPEHIHKE